MRYSRWNHVLEIRSIFCGYWSRLKAIYDSNKKSISFKNFRKYHRHNFFVIKTTMSLKNQKSNYWKKNFFTCFFLIEKIARQDLPRTLPAHWTLALKINILNKLDFFRSLLVSDHILPPLLLRYFTKFKTIEVSNVRFLMGPFK